MTVVDPVWNGVKMEVFEPACIKELSMNEGQIIVPQLQKRIQLGLQKVCQKLKCLLVMALLLILKALAH